VRSAILGRPLFLWVVLFIFGEVLGFYLDLPFLFPILFLVSLGIFVFLIPKFSLPWFFLLLAISLPLGFFLSFKASHPQVDDPTFDRAWGIVEMEPQTKYGGVKFFLKMILREKDGQKEEVAFRVYASYFEEISISKGDLLEVEGKIELPRDEMRDYLRKESCFWVLKASRIEIIGSTLSQLGEALQNLKGAIEEEVKQRVSYPESELLLGVLIGRAADLEEWATLPFRETGTSHILAASGTNVALLVAFFFVIGKFLGLGKRPTLIASIPFVLLYATICGWLPSITRATAVVMVGILSMLSKREKDFPTTIAFSALVVLFFDPLALFFLDFQLSFLAVSCLEAFFPEMQGWIPGRFPKILKDSFFAAVSSQVGVLPLIASQFHSLPLIAPLANMVVLPMVSVLLPAGLLTVSLSLLLPQIGGPLIWLVGKFSALIYQITQGLGAIPLSSLIVPTAPIWLQAIYWAALFFSVGISLLGFKEKTRAIATRFMTLVFAIFVLWLALFPFLFPVRFFEAHFIDVGQGDSILLRMPDGLNFLWDAGGNSKSLKYLQSLGINALDLVFISHFHSDHINGLTPILDNIPVKMVILNREGSPEKEKLEAELKKRGIRYLEIGQGYSIKTKSMRLEILSPPEGASEWKENDRSLVGKVSFGETDFLLPGDIEEKGRNFLKKGGEIEAEVLKVPHHGSATSLDEEFLERVSPEITVISVGKENPYGHPSTVTIDLLKEEEIFTLQTSRDGTISIQTDGRFIKIEKEKW
jgi:competence protein ComEC